MVPSCGKRSADPSIKIFGGCAQNKKTAHRRTRCALSNPHLSLPPDLAPCRGGISKQNCRVLRWHLSPVSFVKIHLKYTKYSCVYFFSSQKKSAHRITQPLCLEIPLQVAGFHRAVPSTTLDKACMQFLYILLRFTDLSRAFSTFSDALFTNLLWTFPAVTGKIAESIFRS